MKQHGEEMGENCAIKTAIMDKKVKFFIKDLFIKYD